MDLRRPRHRRGAWRTRRLSAGIIAATATTTAIVAATATVLASVLLLPACGGSTPEQSPVGFSPTPPSPGPLAGTWQMVDARLTVEPSGETGLWGDGFYVSVVDGTPGGGLILEGSGPFYDASFWGAEGSRTDTHYIEFEDDATSITIQMTADMAATYAVRVSGDRLLLLIDGASSEGLLMERRPDSSSSPN